MSAKRGHVRGSYEPPLTGVLGMGALAVGGLVGLPLEFTIAISNPSAINGRLWCYASDNGAAFVRSATFTQSPIGNLTSGAAGPVTVAGHKYLAYLEAHDLQGELLGRSNVASVQY